MKHLSAITKDGLLFGMDVESTDVRQTMKRTFYKDFPMYKDEPQMMVTRRCVKAADLLPMMESCAWLEKKMLSAVRLEETGPWLQVVYS